MSVNQVSGLISGLDTASLIDALVTARSAPMILLQNRQAEKTAELSAWKSFDAVLLGLKIETERLGNRDLWSQLLVGTSDEDHFTATADATASLGNVDLFVAQLAVAHQVQSDTFTSRDELVGSGTFSLTIDGDTTDLAVAAGSTVSDLARQINDADLGVTAALVRSETMGTESFHLVLTANETGAGSQFTADASGLTGGTTPDFTVNAARLGRDAIVHFGDATGLAIHSSTNTFEDILEGVSVTVRKVHQEDESTELSISRNTDGLQSRVQEFVDRFNDVMSFKNTQYTFDPEVGNRPALMGNATLVNITSQVRRSLLGPVAGLSDATFSTLAGIGITAGADGTLSFDRGKFASSMDEDYDAVANLFRANAGFDAPGVEWLSAPGSIDLGNRSIGIVVSQAAERAKVTGSAIDLAGGLTIDATNDTFQISLDGIRSEDVTIEHGSYTDGDALAAAIAKAVEKSDQLGSLGVRVAWVPGSGTTGALEFTSTKYGSASTITLLNAGTSFASALGLTSVMNLYAQGKDVEGTIGGIEAKGNGQILKIADTSEEELAGLSFRVTLDAADAPTTIQAQFTEGVGRSTTRALLEITDSADGTLARLESSIQKTIERYERDIAAKQDALDIRRARLEKQYAALESTLGRLQSQSNFVGAQLDSLIANRSR